MIKDAELYELYTVQATLKYSELPVPLKIGYSPPFGLMFADLIGDDEIARVFISINGRLINKCMFIQPKELAEKFAQHMQGRLNIKKKSLSAIARKVERSELDYRRKTAMVEAKENDLKIREIFGE